LGAKLPPVRNATGLFTQGPASASISKQERDLSAGARFSITPPETAAEWPLFKVHCIGRPLGAHGVSKSRSGRTIVHRRPEVLLQVAPDHAGDPECRRVISRIAPRSERKISHTSPAAPGVAQLSSAGLDASAPTADTRAGGPQLGTRPWRVLGLGHDGDRWSFGAP